MALNTGSNFTHADGPSPRKRPRTEPRDPLLDLINRSASSSTSDGRVYPLQVVLFFVDRHWDSLSAESRDSVTKELVALLHHDDLHLQSWAYLCLAAIINHSPLLDPSRSSASPLPAATATNDWKTVWALASRKFSNPIVGRSACHALHAVLSRNTLDINYVLKDVERMIADLLVQGPPAPYDSVCAFFSAALRLTNQDVRAHQLRLGDSVLSWLVESWMVVDLSASSRSTIEPFATCDLLHLMEAVCGLTVENEIVCKILLPDTPLVDWLVEYRREDVIRQYFFDGVLPDFQLLHEERSDEHTTPITPVSSAQEPRYSESVPQSQGGEQGMPTATEKKCTALLSRSIEQLWAMWEQVTDFVLVQFFRIRATLEVAVLALHFETSLNLNGTRFNIKLIRRSFELIVHLMGAVATRAWTSKGLALTLQSLEPLVEAWEDDREIPPWEAMIDPGKATGLRREILNRVQNRRHVHHQRRALRRNDVHRLMWQELSVSASTEVTV